MSSRFSSTKNVISKSLKIIVSPGSGMSANGVGWTVAFRLIPGILQAVVKYSTFGSFVI